MEPATSGKNSPTAPAECWLTGKGRQGGRVLRPVLHFSERGGPLRDWGEIVILFYSIHARVARHKGGGGQNRLIDLFGPVLPRGAISNAGVSTNQSRGAHLFSIMGRGAIPDLFRLRACESGGVTRGVYSAVGEKTKPAQRTVSSQLQSRNQGEREAASWNQERKAEFLQAGRERGRGNLAIPT